MLFTALSVAVVGRNGAAQRQWAGVLKPGEDALGILRILSLGNGVVSLK
jgi:hypothetical protein